MVCLAAGGDAPAGPTEAGQGHTDVQQPAIGLPANKRMELYREAMSGSVYVASGEMLTELQVRPEPALRRGRL